MLDLASSYAQIRVRGPRTVGRRASGRRTCGAVWSAAGVLAADMRHESGPHRQSQFLGGTSRPQPRPSAHPRRVTDGYGCRTGPHLAGSSIGTAALSLTQRAHRRTGVSCAVWPHLSPRAGGCGLPLHPASGGLLAQMLRVCHDGPTRGHLGRAKILPLVLHPRLLVEPGRRGCKYTSARARLASAPRGSTATRAPTVLAPTAPAVAARRDYRVD